jgi:hypothetical protein
LLLLRQDRVAEVQVGCLLLAQPTPQRVVLKIVNGSLQPVSRRLSLAGNGQVECFANRDRRGPN